MAYLSDHIQRENMTARAPGFGEFTLPPITPFSDGSSTVNLTVQETFNDKNNKYESAPSLSQRIIRNIPNPLNHITSSFLSKNYPKVYCTYLTLKLGLTVGLDYVSNWMHIPENLTSGLNSSNLNTEMPIESALILKDAKESKEYKHELIRNAKSSIFLSCYMGAETLDETLDLIKECLAKNPKLKVFLLGSDYFLTSTNKKKLNELKNEYPDNYFGVFHPEICLTKKILQSDAYHFTTNHIKLTAIDEGSYFIIGGCALMPTWCNGSGDTNLIRKGARDFLNPVDAEGYRDMDFVFHDKESKDDNDYSGPGRTAFLEGMKLMLRYAYYQNPIVGENLKEEMIKLLNNPTSVEPTIVPAFESREEKVSDTKIRLFASGPEHIQNNYLDGLCNLIENAKLKIVIAHMYFHPPKKLMDAITAAAQRGVNIEIITNTIENETPGAHDTFVNLAHSYCKEIIKCQEYKPEKIESNIKIYGFYRANTTFHKKVVIVDDKFTALGSSNFGLKSLEDNPADYEFNAIVDSEEFAKKTMDVLKKDINMSTLITPEKLLNSPYSASLRTLMQYCFYTPLL